MQGSAHVVERSFDGLGQFVSRAGAERKYQGEQSKPMHHYT